jgi:hypothetical protein
MDKLPESSFQTGQERRTAVSTRVRRGMSLQGIDIATLHRDEKRHAFFRERRDEPLFDRSLKAWIITNEKQVLSLLQSPHLRVTRCASACEDLQQTSGYLFENLIFAFRNIPLCLNGTEHRESRRRLAAFMNERRTAVAAAIPGLVAECFEVLDCRREVELAEEVLHPFVTRFMLAVAGIHADACTVQPASSIFDRLLGLRKRLRLEENVGALRALMQDALGPGASEATGVRIALVILGHDALFGTLGESLFRVLSAQTGLKLSELAFPPTPTDSGVAYVERIVQEPFEHAGVAFQNGDRLRLMLQSFSYTDEPSDRLRLFGAGIHSCLGRPFSIDLWSHITKRLSKLDRRVEILRYELRTDDYLFTCPKTFLVRLAP